MIINAMSIRAGFGARCAAVFCSAALITIAATGFDSPSKAASPMRLTYQVTHSTFGNVGTYINTIERSPGGATTVQTRAHFEVKMLGVTVHREDAQRTEQWQGNRLVSFVGVTNKGGEPTLIRGVARGNNFVINSPSGTITAPATVHPANPWSANFIASNTMMRPDNGRLEKVHVSAGEPTVITVDGRPLRVRKYDVDGEERYRVWIDDAGVPVQFVADNDGTEVTFKLASCSGCGVAIDQQVGLK